MGLSENPNFCKNISVLTIEPIHRDVWAIAYVEQSEQVSPPDISSPNWLIAPAGRYFADPFLTSHQGQPWVFFEDYNESEKFGHIAASPLREFEPRTALKLPWHLSYPFLIESDGELFCIPEQHESGKVSLYRCRRFPDSWVEEAVLLSHFAGVDPTVIYDGEQWWMWVGEQSRQARHHTFLFCAPSLTGPWCEHKQSPAISRCDLARPAGKPWIQDGKWVRPVQIREKTYGGGTALFQVEVLNSAEYLEVEKARWNPRPDWPFPDGLHHICRHGGITIWDAKRVEQHP